MKRWLAVCSVLGALVCGLGACKSETKIQDNPETLKALESCQRLRDEKDKYIQGLEARLAEVEKQSGEQSGEVVVTVTGDAVTVSGKGPSERSGGPAAADEELFRAFVGQVQGARGSMQRCYQNALKKDSGLQARTVTLNIQVKFAADGKVSRATFNPDLGEAFAGCMTAVTKRWTLSGTSAPITFQQPITLSPQ